MPSKNDREMWDRANQLQDDYTYLTAQLSAVRRLRQRSVIELAQYHSIPEIAAELGMSEATVWSIFYTDYSDRPPGRPANSKTAGKGTNGKKRG
jgi:AraC-like DNA-binding protein